MNNPVPSLLPGGRSVTGKDIATLLADAQDRALQLREQPRRSNLLSIVGSGTHSTALAGLIESARTYPLSPSFDTQSTVDGGAADDDINTIYHSDGNLLIDLAQVPDRRLAFYLGTNSYEDEAENVITREVYAALRIAVPHIITSVTSVHSNIWAYTGRQAKLARSAAAITQPWVFHPDAPSVTMYNLSEDQNTATTAYNGQVEFTGQFTSINPIPVGRVVFAFPWSHPRYGEDEDAGECWWFDVANKANVSCPDDLNRLFSPF